MMSEPRSLFEQWKAGHTALTFESWLVKHIKELEGEMKAFQSGADRATKIFVDHIAKLEAQIEALRGGVQIALYDYSDCMEDAKRYMLEHHNIAALGEQE
jgi:hypothetical protein